jgi:hypothetical protein
MHVSGFVPEYFSLNLEITLRPCRPADLLDLEWFGLFTPSREIAQKAFERYRRGENMMLVAEANRFPVGQIWVDHAQKAYCLIRSCFSVQQAVITWVQYSKDCLEIEWLPNVGSSRLH